MSPRRKGSWEPSWAEKSNWACTNRGLFTCREAEGWGWWEERGPHLPARGTGWHCLGPGGEAVPPRDEEEPWDPCFGETKARKGESGVLGRPPGTGEPPRAQDSLFLLLGHPGWVPREAAGTLSFPAPSRCWSFPLPAPKVQFCHLHNRCPRAWLCWGLAVPCPGSATCPGHHPWHKGQGCVPCPALLCPSELLQELFLPAALPVSGCCSLSCSSPPETKVPARDVPVPVQGH